MTRQPAHITFIGNEGVVVTTSGGTFAIDALFGDGAAAYTSTPPAVIDAVEAARPPFEGIEVLLATHHHPDHFDPRAVARHLTANPRTRLVTTNQAIALLEERSEAFVSLADRIYAMPAADGVRESISLGGIRIDGFGLSHGRVNFGGVQHLGFVVYAGGLSFVHLGDGIIDRRALTAAGVLDEEVDAAILPFWFLTYPFGRRLMRERFRPRRVFAAHIAPQRQAELEREIASALPSATPLVRPMASFAVE